MYIQVKLLHGFKEPLLYRTPPEWASSLCIGALVKVPLRNKETFAYVEKIIHQKPATSFEIKQAIGIEKIPKDPFYFDFIAKLAYYYQTEPLHFFKRLQFFLQAEAHQEQEEIPEPCERENHVTLTQEQENVVTKICDFLHTPGYAPTVLHGVTGSGKTEVYKKIIEETIRLNKSVILLLPEVSLALQFMHIMKMQLSSSIVIASFHSAVNKAEKKKLWADLLQEKPMLIIGVHLPLLLPIANLGLIIVDEEHDQGYQEKKHPKINSKEAALMRAHLLSIPIVLGSATPSISSLYNVEHKKWHFLQLKQRFKGIFPAISIVKLTDKQQRKNFWISKQLQDAITQQLAKKEQTLIFINRRGFSFFVQCKECSFIFYCSACSVSLTLHEDQQLVCHYCGLSKPLVSHCPQCRCTDLLKKGIGTQQIVHILQSLFPTARIARADHDSTVNKKKWHATITDFYTGALDILVGTQTITKGYHFPKVSLVGILWADLNVHFPIYNAFETTLQQLIQVAGRAGRAGLPSRVIVQSMADHDIFSHIDELSYKDFYTKEIENRSLVHYPPCIRLAEIELKYHDEAILHRESLHLAQVCQQIIAHKNLPVTLLGPAKPPLAKLKNWHIRKMYCKSSSIDAIISLFQTIDQKKYASSIFFTPNPLN